MAMPLEAVAFMGAVVAVLALLIVFFLFLNKQLCFSKCGGFTCMDKPPKAEAKSSKLGSAYAYDEDETSSDSDDEILKRYQTSLQAGGMNRVPSSRSMKSGKSGVSRKTAGTKGPGSITGSVAGSKVAAGSVKTAGKKGGHDDDSSNPDSEIEESSSPHNTLSPQSPEQEGTEMVSGAQTYDNKAYHEGMSPSDSERALSAGASTEEHLFDVSDLHTEAPLISKCGSLEVTFNYNANKQCMTLVVHQGREIPTKDRGGANNSQVRLLLLPTRKQRHKTKVKAGENTEFEETFVFNKIAQDSVENMGIRFRLYGCERMRRERMIGEAIIGFASLNLDVESTHWIVLEPRSNLSQGDSHFDVSSLSRSDSASSTQSMQHGGMPELLLGLAYNGTTGRLSVEVLKGSNFRNMAMSRAPDTYVKLTLMSPNGQEIARSKTSIRRGQPNPLFKEQFMFQVALFQLPDVTLMVSIYNKKSMKRKEMIGWFSLGMNSSGEEELSHWTDMRESKGDQVCRWHVLLES